MKRTVIITVMSEDERLSCSERFEWNTDTYFNFPLVERLAFDAQRSLTLLEAKGPWKRQVFHTEQKEAPISSKNSPD